MRLPRIGPAIAVLVVLTAINFLKGQVMKATRGSANPAIAEQLLRQQLESGA